MSAVIEEVCARDQAAPSEIELSIVMPCLNEAETLEKCIRKARQGIAANELSGEIIVADNGSTDGSQAIAERLGARVVPIAEKGYGNALRGGIEAARGKYVIMGDSDDSYDFSAIHPFLVQLRAGHDLVMGNRFRGGIMPGAMPLKHRFFGNPALTFLGRLFFGAPVKDFQCGLRGFSKDAFHRMELQTGGMEFASEMVIKAAKKRMKITEVPTKLHKDGRSRPPHLRSWRDGWRNVRFMLLFSPRWLFLIPGLVLIAFSLVASLSLWLGPQRVGSVVFDIHTLLVTGFLTLVGYQLVTFAVFAKILAVREGFHPPHPTLNWLFRYITLEVGVLLGLTLMVAGMGLLGSAVWGWRDANFGPLDPAVTMREVIPAVVLSVLGLQTVFSSFFISLLSINARPPRPQ